MDCLEKHPSFNPAVKISSIDSDKSNPPEPNSSSNNSQLPSSDQAKSCNQSKSHDQAKSRDQSADDDGEDMGLSLFQQVAESPQPATKGENRLVCMYAFMCECLCV